MSPPFAAPAWLKSGHLQTIYGATLWQPETLVSDQRLTIRVDDENAVLCLLNQARAQPGPACLILLHGLEASAEAPYIASTARKALADGWDVLRMNLRSCGGSHHLAATSYHGGLSGDALAVAQHAVSKKGYQRIAMAGFSLGGHTLLKLAGELGADYPPWLKGICAISPPLKLGSASAGLMHPRNRIYERYFYKNMLRSYRARHRLWPESTPMAVLSRVHNLYEFDDLITAPAFGYRDAEDYYSQNSALQWVDQIRLPVRIIFALDDPIIPFNAHRQAMALNNPAVSWLLSAEGGHVGFFNTPTLAAQDRDALWAENRLLETVAKWLIIDPD